jgi:hypothetical protein
VPPEGKPNICLPPNFWGKRSKLKKEIHQIYTMQIKKNDFFYPDYSWAIGKRSIKRLAHKFTSKFSGYLPELAKIMLNLH